MHLNNVQKNKVFLNGDNDVDNVTGSTGDLLSLGKSC